MLMDRHDIVREIQRTAQQNNGQPLGAKRFQDETGIEESDWFGKYWRNWGDALLEAGFPPNQMQAAYDETALISGSRCLRKMCEHSRSGGESREVQPNSAAAGNGGRRLASTGARRA